MSSVVPFRACHSRHVPSNARPDPQRVAEIVKSFNTWAFKREQPSDLALLHHTVSVAATGAVPLEFVLYWGKGPRSRIGAPEHECFEFLGKLTSRVGDAYSPGAHVHLVLTDTHARLNGHREPEIASYFADVTAAAQSRSFGVSRLSDVVAGAGVPPPMSAPPTLETLSQLEKCAAKWYRGDGAPVEAARQYFELNMIEKHAVECLFPASIFVTFNDSTYRVLFPDRLPVFYMYSVRRGVAVKPWFMPDDNGDDASHRVRSALDAAE